MSRIVWPSISNDDVREENFFGMSEGKKALFLLQNFSNVHVTQVVTGGAANSNTDSYEFVAPTKLEILKADAIKDVAPAGASNTPTIKMLAGADEVGATAAITAGNAGDVHALTLDADHVVVAAGTKIILRISTPAGATVDTAIKAKLQFLWKAVS